MHEQQEIVQRMAEVRSRGLVNAHDLGHDVERLSDWREHVRAYPIPLALGAAIVGYWMIPARKTAVPKTQTVRSESSELPYPTTQQPVQETKRFSLAGLSGAAMGFVGTLAANAARSYISEQMHSLVYGDSEHGPFQQRQTPARRA